MEEDKIYSLKLHDSYTILGYKITRVCGGWIYCRQEPAVNVANPVFVPFDNEFIIENVNF